ncbi:MAG: ArnT family glycosyltransferase [Actinomycetota bacterium]
MMSRLLGRAGDSRLSWTLLIPLALYLAGFAIFPPKSIVINDEGLYVSQAVAFAGRHRTAVVRDPLTGEERNKPPSTYPIGTSILQVPFVYFGGWRNAAWLSVVSVILATFLLGKWLSDAGRPTWFALMFLAYLPTLVLGRVAMSELPTAAVVTLGLWLFWRGQEGPRWTWLLAGWVAGLSLLFRETAVLAFAPLFAGAVLRRDRGWPALMMGGIAGAGMRLVSSTWMFSTPFFTRDPGYSFSPSNIQQNVLLYTFALLVLLPGGLMGVLAYRGARRAEVIATVVLSLAFFLLYGYSGIESGFVKRIVLGPRFFIPVVPVIVFACAESFPRLWRRASHDEGRWGYRWRKLLPRLAVGLVAGISFAVHPIMARWAQGQGTIGAAIYSVTAPNSALVTNMVVPGKFFNLLQEPHVLAPSGEYPPSNVPRIRAVNRDTYLVFLDRTDSEFYRRECVLNERYLEQVERLCRLTLVHDRRHSATDRLRIWRVEVCNGVNPGPDRRGAEISAGVEAEEREVDNRK